MSSDGKDDEASSSPKYNSATDQEEDEGKRVSPSSQQQGTWLEVSSDGSHRSNETKGSENKEEGKDEKSKHPLVELFVGDLSYFCTEEKLRALFSEYGTVAEARVRRGERNGHSLMHGFVKMTSLRDANRSAEALDDAMYMGRRLRVEVCTLEGSFAHKEPRPGVHVHVSFNSQDNENIFTEVRMREVFQEYGEVTDVIIKRHLMDAKGQKGYGFVYFATEQQAENAISDLQQKLVDGYKFECALSQKPDRSSKSKSKTNSFHSTNPFSSDNNIVPNQHRLSPPTTMQNPVDQQFAHYPGMSHSNFASSRSNFDPSSIGVHQVDQHQKRARLGKGSQHHLTNGNPNLRLPTTTQNRIPNQVSNHNNYQMNNVVQNRMNISPNVPPSHSSHNPSMITYWSNQPSNPTPQLQNHTPHSNYGMYPLNMNGNGWFATTSVPSHTSISYEVPSRQSYPPPPPQNQMVYYNNGPPSNSFYSPSLPSPRPYSAVSQPPNLYTPYSSELPQPRANNPFLAERDGGIPQNFNYR